MARIVGAVIGTTRLRIHAAMRAETAGIGA